MKRMYRLRESVSEAKRSFQPIRDAALDYIKSAHPKVAGRNGHVHARFTKAGNWQRYYIPLLACFERAGYSVSHWPSASFLRTPPSEEFGLFRIPWLRVSPSSNISDILLTDSPAIASRVKHQRVLLLMEDHNRPELSSNETRLPVLMHPNMYIKPDWKDALERAPTDGPRDVRLTFVGNFDPKQYDSAELVRNYGVLTRSAIANSLLQSHAESSLWIRTWGEKSRLENNSKPIVMVDSYKAGLGPDEYFRQLGRSEFFLAMPGLTMPNCHNLAEALRMGCIPILQAPHWRTPLPLVSMVNCVAFDSLATLSSAVDFVLSANTSRINTMRAQVRQVSQDFLEPEGFVERIRQGMGRSNEKVSILLVHPDG